MTCTARMRPFVDWDICDCELDDNHRGHHSTTIRDRAYPGSTTRMHWLESDRRTFRGEWIECPERGCTLPAGHPRDHFVEPT